MKKKNKTSFDNFGYGNPQGLLAISLYFGPPGSTWCFFFCSGVNVVSYSAPRDLHRKEAYSICEFWLLIHQDVYYDLYVSSC